MNTNRLIAILCMCVAVGLVGYLFELSPTAALGQPVIGSQQLRPCCASMPLGPRRPQDIVNLDGTLPGLDPGASQVVYTVPNNKWLIVTDAEASRLNHLLSGSAASQQLIEDVGGVQTVKRNENFLTPWLGHHDNAAPAPYNSSVGMAFQPGSEVRIKVPNDYEGPYPIDVSYTLTGYLAKP